jgi:5'-nucleotidase (lipoprotein e(P4) family)
MKRYISLWFILIILTGCSHSTVPVKSSDTSQDALILSALWYQKSGEMRAIYYQCYRNAAEALDKNRAIAAKGKPLAVVLDIDETVLDNSPFEGWQILNNSAYSQALWNKWVLEADAKALPGAVEFTRHADSTGVAVFYISNRDVLTRDATIQNLRKEGFACADTNHLFLKDKSSSKVTRREIISEKYNIILLIGDNLADLDGVFENRQANLGINDVEAMKSLFGSRYIILPNPMYGNWLTELLKTAEGKTYHEKLLRQVNAMK